MSKTVVLRVSTERLLNIEHGLSLLHSRMIELYNNVNPADLLATELKTVYKEKVVEIEEQIRECKTVLQVE